MIIGAIILILLVAYLFLLKPNSGRKEQLKPFEDTYIAHRGFFDNEKAPENSMPAFERAVEKGYGIELDVQATTDGELVVFHDASLERMCGVNKKLTDCTYDELMEYRLGESDEKIPRYLDVLSMISGKVPLLIEIKPEGDYIGTIEKVTKVMDDYSGIYCVQSFEPRVLRWLKKNRPEIVRGQLSMNFVFSNVELSLIKKILMSNLLLNFYAKPDFISYKQKHSSQLSYVICRKLFGVTNAGWTIRSQKQLNKAKKNFQIMIFDSFEPK
ncbi:MAG: glycerophosphodiester phosphodiesterase [Lachnospiraceae bacterium]|nr:glycerophosphodiester phosphodiesterase [Lachnospiraceae bacterium]